MSFVTMFSLDLRSFHDRIDFYNWFVLHAISIPPSILCVQMNTSPRIQSSWTNTIFHEVNTMGHIIHDAPLPWLDATNSYTRKTDSRYQTMHPLCWIFPFLAIVYHQIHFSKTGNENVGAFSQIYGLVIQMH